PESRPGAKPETVTGREALVEKVAGAARLEVVEGQPKAPEKILTPESRALAGVDGPAEPIKFNITGDPAVVEAFQRGANLAIEAVQLNSEAAAGKFQQFAATEGQAMGRTMLEMAHMLNSKALIDVVSEAYKIDKPASLVVRGEALAKLAADPESQQPDRTAMFFDYAKNEGSNRGPELLEYAKQVGDPRLQIVVKEAYLLAQGKQAPRLNEPVSLQLTEEQAGRWIDFMTLVKDLPLEPENYGQFRYNLFTWMNANPDLVPSVIKYASVHPASQIAGPVDYYAPEHSNSLARFPVLESKGAPVVEPVAKSVEESAAETAPQPVEQGKTQGLEKLPEVELVEAPPEARPEPVQKTNVESGAKVESTSKGRRLWESFITSKTPQIKESNARLLTEHFGQMTPLEFKQYLDFVFERPDGPDGAPRLNRLWIPSSRVLQSKPVTEAYEASPEGKGPLEAFQHFLSANKAETPDFPPWLSEYVNMRLMYARSIAPEGAAPHEVLDLALPRNLIRDIRTNFIDITLKPVPQPEVSPKLPQELADIFEAARQSDTRNVQVGRPPREQGNTIADRMDRLTELLEIKDEAIRNRLIELGGKDHPRLKNITGKLDPETSAPEYKELLQIALPGAQRLSEVSTMLDAIFSAGKTRRNSPNSPEVLATEQLAIAALQQMVPGNSPKLARGEQIIHDMITGKIRDPRPGGGGFGGNAGGRPAGGFQGQNQPREHGGGDRGLGKRESGVNKGDRAPVVPVKPAPEAEVVAALKTDPVVKPEVVVEGETSTGAKNAAPLEKDSTV
ncbi:MAG: hypothetical protein K8F91_25455, partial [Candidatus Obscuribacterales bacterium]|nr:hypothetical protein [Candidatus Obscuribacterales bacterium]